MRSILLILALTLAAAIEALTGTLLALGRGDIMGDTLATPDEFAWLDIGYIALKITGFALAPMMLSRIPPERLLTGVLLIMAVSSGLSALLTDLRWLLTLRAVHGLGGGVMLVAAQAMLFWAYPREQQPLVQAFFAVGAVVVPTAVAPALQGWLIDTQSWAWVMSAIVPISMAATGILIFADRRISSAVAPMRFDPVGTILLLTAALAATFALRQGSRWQWFESSLILSATALALVAALGFLGWQRLLRGEVFGTQPFPFVFCVSFVAGAALFGSAFIIPNFTVSILGFTVTETGRILLPGAPMFLIALMIVALATQRFRIPILLFAPIGIGLVMTALWLLSGVTSASGAEDMMAAVLLRGLGLGMMFLALTMMAFSALPASQVAFAIAIFNIGRQIGGLIGVAGLQSLIDQQVAINYAAITANLTEMPARVVVTVARLQAVGLDAAQAALASQGLLRQAIVGQASVSAFETGFAALALMFVMAVPCLIVIKVVLSRLPKA